MSILKLQKCEIFVELALVRFKVSTRKEFPNIFQKKV